MKKIYTLVCVETDTQVVSEMYLCTDIFSIKCDGASQVYYSH